jgi:hypothetical protein
MLAISPERVSQPTGLRRDPIIRPIIRKTLALGRPLGPVLYPASVGVIAICVRDREFADSLVEGDGFEPSVPLRSTTVRDCPVRALGTSRFRGKNTEVSCERDRRFESRPLQR